MLVERRRLLLTGHTPLNAAAKCVSPNWWVSSMPATAARSTGDEKVELRTGMPVNQRRANASRDPDRRLSPYRGGIPKQTAGPMPEPRFRERFIDGSRAPLRAR